MKRKQKRTSIIGALIFLMLVALIGFGLIVTGTFHNPLTFSMGGPRPISSSASGPQDTGAGISRGPGSQDVGAHVDRDPGSFPGHSGPPEGEDTNGIAWNQIGGVFSDLWILSAIVACYILVQQTLRLIINRFWSRKYPQPTP